MFHSGFLSGGIDSSLVASVAQNIHGGLKNILYWFRGKPV